MGGGRRAVGVGSAGGGGSLIPEMLCGPQPQHASPSHPLQLRVIPGTAGGQRAGRGHAAPRRCHPAAAGHSCVASRRLASRRLASRRLAAAGPPRELRLLLAGAFFSESKVFYASKS